MMQQQMCQQDQVNQQPGTQQMVLCPVKVVYETQILVPPGEQIQPNQTIFINPQNTPPWAHNRLQNQLIYVHQMPNNIVPNMQQNIDPNQMYIQSYPYQMSQQILAQNPQEQRPMQIANMHQNINMMQTVPNVGANLPERTVQMTNFCQMPNQIVPNRQMASNIGVTLPNQHQQINEIQRPYMNVRPQIHHYLNNARPQVVSNQNINMPQNVGQTFATIPQRQIHINAPNMSTIQRMVTPMQSTVPRMNTPTFNVVPPNPVQMPPKFMDSSTDTTDAIPRHTIANTATKATNVHSFTLKNTQNRTQYRHNVPNIGKLIQPTQHTNTNIQKEKMTTNTSVNTENTLFNRKRKSESPDEVQKKMLTNPANRDNDPPMQFNDIRDTISNIQKNLLNENTILQISNNGAQLVKLDDIIPTTVASTSNMNQSEKDKLLRNTVYTQAKGRVLNDKEMVPNEGPSTESQTETKEEESKHYVTIVKIERLDAKEESKPKDEVKEETVKEDIKKESVTEQCVPLLSQNLSEQKIEFKEKLLNDHQILTHVLDGYVIQESNVAFPIRKPIKEKTVTHNGKDKKGQRVRNTKEKTPIDLPLLPFHFLQLDNVHKKEKPKQEKSTQEETTQEKTTKNETTQEETTKEEITQEERAKEEVQETPFTNLQKSTVKSWTVEQLTNHLSKNNWADAASIFRDHEIDGESLFMVSKMQLVQIGISEEYAETICEFIKN